MSEPIQITQANFQSVVSSAQTPVLVDFWAPWCAPCRMLAPVIDDLAAAYEGKAIICKINIDDSPELASRYGVMSIPTLMVFVGGEAKEKVVGVQPREAIEGLIDTHL